MRLMLIILLSPIVAGAQVQKDTLNAALGIGNAATIMLNNANKSVFTIINNAIGTSSKRGDSLRAISDRLSAAKDKTQDSLKLITDRLNALVNKREDSLIVLSLGQIAALVKKRVSDSLANRPDSLIAKAGQLIMRRLNSRAPYKYELNADPIATQILVLNKLTTDILKRVLALETAKATVTPGTKEIPVNQAKRGTVILIPKNPKDSITVRNY